MAQGWSRWGGGLVLALASLACAADSSLVAVVVGEHSARQAPKGEGRGAQIVAERVESLLRSAGIAYARLNDTELDADRLKPFKAAVFPYSFAWPEGLVAAVDAYVKGGGKIVTFYTVPPRLAELIGAKRGAWESKEPRPRYATIRLRQDLVPGLPASVLQDSHNIYPVEADAADAQQIGEWLDRDGKPLGLGALVLSPRGAYMGHVLTRGDVASKGQMLRAVVGKLVPEVWQRASRRVLAAAEAVGPLPTFDALAKRIETARVSDANRGRASERLAGARQLVEKARLLAAEGKHAEAIEAVAVARPLANGAFALSSAERLEELRGVWIHTAYGVADWGWERSIKHLADSGFNAIFPNMLWAGLAHYPSDVLPVAPDVKAKGDQIAECLKWCKQFGVELHVWKVNYNLSHAPKGFIGKLRAEGRLQANQQGAETPWLCPSDPRNLALERDSMLEVVRKYEVQGVHFDYIRYPGMRGCFCRGCLKRFETAAQVKVKTWPADALRPPLKERFHKWRQDQITALVRAVAVEARRIRPGTMISAAVFGNWESHRWTVGQDWKLWVDEGLLDFVCPMNYTTSPKALATLVRRQIEWVNGRVPLYSGIGAWRLGDAVGLLDQLERARALGADGFVCFHYNDLTFAGRRLPQLHKSHTATRTPPPHMAPRITFDLSPGTPGLPGLAYVEGDEIRLAADVTTFLPPRGNYPSALTSELAGHLHVETTEGRPVRKLGFVSTGGDKAPHTVPLPPGRYRLIVRGTVGFKEGDQGPFVVRSRPFEVVPKAAAAALAAKRQPPRFDGPGLRVGVAIGGYGSDALLAALKKAKGINAAALNKITREFLKPCQVVVYPQPRRTSPTREVELSALRLFVGEGGGLLATHDAPGFRAHPVLLPGVCRGGSARVEGATWAATAADPLTQGLKLGQPVPHSYYDFIALTPGPEGQVVAEGIAKDGKARAPVVIRGPVAKGRYVATGLALGIGARDAEREPTGAELTLLLNAIRWLGGQ